MYACAMAEGDDDDDDDDDDDYDDYDDDNDDNDDDNDDDAVSVPVVFFFASPSFPSLSPCSV